MAAENMDADALSASLGAAVRGRRKSLGLRLVDVAEAADVSQAFLSQIENGAAASLFTHHRIAAALDTTLHSLLEVAASPPIGVVRRDEGEWLPLVAGMKTRTLVGGAGHSLEANETIAAPGTSTFDEPFAHPGEDLVIVLEGVFEYSVGDLDPVELHPGDVMHYPAAQPHSFRVVGDNEARLLIINTPGSLMTGKD
ncbi:MAG: XRE family transcriptional regulator [Acidimicrobiia bacterium]|nr:XRE family transcriptional regulator [Acidimicrobiia bacterium]